MQKIIYPELPKPEPLPDIPATKEPSSPSTDGAPDEQGYFIVINTRKNKLFLYYDSALQDSFPIASGKPSTRTPVGRYMVIKKVRNPSWKSPWGRIVPPGPKNPLGKFWLGLRRLGVKRNCCGYGIHGTNQPRLIGSWVSRGCIRMHNENAEYLFQTVPVGTPVKVVR